MTDDTREYDYDYLVIGGGSGGIASAKRAASLYNAKVAGKFNCSSGRTLIYEASNNSDLMYMLSNQ
jgi:succinate dehydrogenase/fumarate reductase flavoprotein subunit